jgi:6-phosphogluconolactonase
VSRQFVYPDLEQTAAAAANYILGLLEERLSGESYVTLAISGGTSPARMFDVMAKRRFDWRSVHLFWVDERAVPPTDNQSNYRMAEEHLIVPGHIPVANVHRVHAELPPDEAARKYVDDIRDFFKLGEGQIPTFDIVHRGMGPDAHTASLFPGEPLIDDREKIAAAVYVEKFQQWRITLLAATLLAAHQTVMFVTGEDKAKAAHAVFHEPYDPKEYPAQISAHHGRSVSWFFDKAAARLLE